MEKGTIGSKKFKNLNSIVFQGLGIILWACSSALWVILHFSGKIVFVCSWVVLLACFLPVEFWGWNSLLSSSDPFSSSQWYFCVYKILKNFLGLLYISWGVTIVEVHPLSSLYNPTSIFGFCWDLKDLSHALNLVKEPFVWLNILTFWSFWGVSKRLNSHTSGFFSKTCFRKVTLLILASFAIHIGCENFLDHQVLVPF